MLHDDNDKFINVVHDIQAKTGFSDLLLEKDYYLSLILSNVGKLSDGLVFKGGTCLNKVYYSYFRLSEDLDFTMKLPTNDITRGMRSRSMKPIKEDIAKYVENFGMKLDTTVEPARNENKQYIFVINYYSIFAGKTSTIKFEVGLRFNPLLEVSKKAVMHNFISPFGEPLVENGVVNCLDLKEAVSEKLRAATGREVIAPRDFYDLDFLIRNEFNIASPEVLRLFKLKTKEEAEWEGLAKYSHNLGRTDKEIKDMRSRIENELFPVLSSKERDRFDLDKALDRINKAFDRV